MGRKILFITTDQQRYDALGCNGGHDRAHAGRRRARRIGDPVRARVQPEHGVHAGAVDDADRPVRAHARRDRQRRAAAAGRAVDRRVPARPGGLPHRAAGQGALRAGLRLQAPLGRELHVGTRDGRSVPRVRARRARGARAVGGQARAAALRPLVDRYARRRGDQGLLAPAGGRAGRRDRRAGDPHQPDPARLVPHRLGRRPHDCLPRLAARRLRLVRLDVVPRPAPPVGPAGVGAAPRATGATSTCRPATPVRTTRSSAC